MTSAIDTSFITSAPVPKADLKDALDTAASEITALQDGTIPFVATGTTTARAPITRAADVLHLRDFGAIGNGVADDTAAINAWISAVLATGKPGYFGEGHFRYTGTRFEMIIGGLAATQGGQLIGAGGARTILDVSACSGTPQFLVRCQANFLFYWTFRGFEVRGNRDGVMAQFGQDWTGSAYPDALNSCSLVDLVFRNNSTGTNAIAVRYNLVLESTFHTIANCGSNALLNGIAHDLQGVQFSIGKITGGNSQYAMAFRQFTFGNNFNGELAVCRHIVLLETPSGWNKLSGNFGWGAPNADPAISGTDTATTTIIATQAGSPLVFAHESNWAATPTITGAAAAQVWVQNRGIGVQLAEGWRLRPESSTADPSVLFIPAASRSGWLQFFRGGSPDRLRWLVGMNDVNNIVFQRYNASGVFQDTPLFLNESNGRVQMTTAQVSTSLILPTYTVAGLPSASPAQQLVYVSNESGGAVVAFSDGTNWRRVTDRAIVS